MHEPEREEEPSAPAAPADSDAGAEQRAELNAFLADLRFESHDPRRQRLDKTGRRALLRHPLCTLPRCRAAAEEIRRRRAKGIAVPNPPGLFTTLVREGIDAPEDRATPQHVQEQNQAAREADAAQASETAQRLRREGPEAVAAALAELVQAQEGKGLAYVSAAELLAGKHPEIAARIPAILDDRENRRRLASAGAGAAALLSVTIANCDNDVLRQCWRKVTVAELLNAPWRGTMLPMLRAAVCAVLEGAHGEEEWP